MAKKKNILKENHNLTPRIRFLTPILISLLFLYLGWLYLTHIDQVSFHPDEHEFIRKSYYFNLFFIKRDFNDPRWTKADSYKQPKIGLYIYGLTLHLQGINDIEAKLKELNFGSIHNPNEFERLQFWQWWKKPNPNPPEIIQKNYEIVWNARIASSIFSLLTLAMLFILLKQKNLLFSFIATYFLGANILMIAFGKRAMTDSMQLFAFISNILLTTLLIKAFQENKIEAPTTGIGGFISVRQSVNPPKQKFLRIHPPIEVDGFLRRRTKKTILLSLLIGLNLTFAVGVKISGILIVPFLGVVFILLGIQKKSSKHPNTWIFQSVLLIALVFFSTFIALHPYLYSQTPQHFIAMFVDRMKDAYQYQIDAPLLAIHSPLQAVNLIIQSTFFSEKTANFKLAGFQLDFLLFIAGVWILCQEAYEKFKKSKELSLELLLILWTAVTVVGLSLYLKNDFPRYYLPTVANATIIEAYGLSVLLKKIIERTRA